MDGFKNSLDLDLRERARNVVPGGMWGHMNAAALPEGYPQFFARGAGSRLWDVDGNEYLDFMCSWGPIILGHHHPEVDEAARRQLELGDCLNGPGEAMVQLSEAKRLLLQKMLRGEGARPERAEGAVTPRPPGTIPPLSIEQRQVWLHAAMAADQPIYNEPITIHRRGPFDLTALEASFNEVLRRHEIWRTSFEVVDGDVVQVVHPELHVGLKLIDLTGLSEAEREAEALRLATLEARKPFDLATVPLLRASVMKLAEDDHRLHLTLHHIIFDGVAIYRVLVPELARLYEAFASGRCPTLPEPALQYGDYAHWRARQVTGESITRQLDHWRRELAGELPVLQLPTDRPRPSVLAHRGAMETFDLSLELTERLKALSRRDGATTYMTLLAAFKVLLFRYSGQDDILVGGVTDTRRRPELEGLIGYFLNSMVLRTRPRGELTFRGYLAQVRHTVLGALDASDVPFDRIVRELRPRRDPGRHPLFEVLFSIEPPVPTFADGWDLTQMDVPMGATKFDLYLELDERPEGMIGRFLYSTDLFDAATIRRMIGHWTTILEAVVADPDRTLGELPLLTGAERRQMLVEWNATECPRPSTTVHAWVEDQIRRTPDAVAVEVDGRSWTYRDLGRRSGQLAARLRAAGAGRGSVVAICVERSFDMVAAVLAVLNVGGAYLPIDRALPQARMALMLEDARPAAVLTQDTLLAALPATDARILLCEEEDGTGDSLPDGGAAEVDAEDLAYVLYTSGSTGRPKGVEIPHRALVNLLASVQREPGFTAADRLLSVTTLSFDIATLELLLPLVSGGRVIIVSREVAADPLRLAERIDRSGCTVVQATPATWRALVEAGWSGRPGLKIFCGGEALSRDLADRLLRGGARLWNMYGPTETTIYSTVHEVTPGSGPVPIGRPIADTTAYILDPRGQPVPVGVAGELHLGGAGLARGYRHREDLTAQRFAPVIAAGGARLYRTGDIARYRADGSIECLGRVDSQVKVRGYRIELGEIEAALGGHDGVAAAAVRTFEDAAGERSLVAYLVARDGVLLDAAPMRQFLRRTLPGYMIPARYVLLPALPMTPSGKIDRNALALPTAEPLPVAEAGPRDDLERKLVAIWQDVLHLPTVGVRDDFFDQGGHSLLVARLLRRVEAEFGRRLSMASVFAAPTIEQMASLLREEAGARPLPHLVHLQPSGSRTPLFWLDAGPMFRGLAQALAPDQPFIGVTLDSPELAALLRPLQLSEVAAQLIPIIREAQPSGPYYLGGWCKAGVLAYEVALQMKEQGHEVGLLVMVHPSHPEHYRQISTFRRRLGFYAAQARRRRGGERWGYAGKHLAALLRKPWQTAPVVEQSAFELALEKASLAHRTRPYAGDVLMLEPVERLAEWADFRAAWERTMRGEFTAVELPGGHFSMFEQPYLREVAARIDACLSRAQRTKEGGRLAAE